MVEGVPALDDRGPGYSLLSTLQRIYLSKNICLSKHISQKKHILKQEYFSKNIFLLKNMFCPLCAHLNLMAAARLAARKELLGVTTLSSVITVRGYLQEPGCVASCLVAFLRDPPRGPAFPLGGVPRCAAGSQERDCATAAGRVHRWWAVCMTGLICVAAT